MKGAGFGGFSCPLTCVRLKGQEVVCLCPCSLQADITGVFFIMRGFCLRPMLDCMCISTQCVSVCLCRCDKCPLSWIQSKRDPLYIYNTCKTPSTREIIFIMQNNKTLFFYLATVDNYSFVIKFSKSFQKINPHKWAKVGHPHILSLYFFALYNHNICIYINFWGTGLAVMYWSVG